MPTSTFTDVLICGAGPTGLLLALALTRLGVRVRIIDTLAGPSTTSRALAVQTRTLELYDLLDLTDQVVRDGHRVPGVNLWTNGEWRARLPLEDIADGLTPHVFILIYPQDKHERLLIDRLAASGVTVERECELPGLEDSACARCVGACMCMARRHRHSPPGANAAELLWITFRGRQRAKQRASLAMRCISFVQIRTSAPRSLRASPQSSNITWTESSSAVALHSKGELWWRSEIS